ncbi:MAG: hypothetical protein AAGF28_03305 [Pseudomonadota bacterium]
MSAMPTLNTRLAVWDKFRDAVVVPAGANQVVITIEALESWANRSLTPDEALETAIDEKAMFREIANTLAAQDNVITVTSGILNSRSWAVQPYDDGPEDSGPIYPGDPT